MTKSTDVISALRSKSSSGRAFASACYFKTGRGEYGEGDVFIGVTVPIQREIAKRFRTLSLSEIRKLLKSKIHEHRLTALFILVNVFELGSESEREKVFKFYLSNTSHINNWDLVDSSARYIVGRFLADKKRDVLYKLAQSKNIWERRISIVSTHHFIYAGDLKDAFKIVKILLTDSHVLIHKALGWTLREAGKKKESALTSYLQKHFRKMPRTTLRYAIERFPEKKRQAFLSGNI